MKKDNFYNKEVVVGICGGIAAYKVPELIRLLKKEGLNITCVLTENSERFITPLTLQTLSQNVVYKDLFNEFKWDIEHISISNKADLVVVIPATADTISKLATGRAEDLLSSIILSTKAPILICPSMNENMWTHPATQKNVDILKSYGYYFIGPEKGELACGVSGIGRLSDIKDIFEKIKLILSNTSKENHSHIKS